MASKIDNVGFSLPTVKEKAQAVSSLRFDWIMVVVSVWWLGGLFIDGWAHSNIPQLETFFTPWHAVFYSGYLAVAFTLFVQILLNLRQSAISTGGSTPSLVTLVRESLPGNRWLRAIPTGYELSVLGLAIFAVSGIGDMTWHLILGIERSTEALLSPTHLGLALGIGLALSGPLRAAWRRSGVTPSWGQLGPAILSLTFTFSLLTFFTEYASPLIIPWPIINSRGGSGPTSGITDILLITALTMSFVLLALRSFRLPFGTVTFMFGLNGALMVVFNPNSLLVSVPTALLGGIAADLVYRFLEPSLDHPASVRLFAFLVPAMFYALYFVDLAIVGPIKFQGGILWSAPFWAGAPLIAGITGFLLSFVMLPPAQVAEEKDKPVV
jgi:hypothetical protein